MLDLLETEQKKEMEREEQLAEADDEEKKRLEKVFGVERAKASNRIIKMSEYVSLYKLIENTIKE
jgi:hypothetical protein